MDEVVHEFLVESHENLDQLDRDLVALEQDPTSRPLLAGVFRTIHTIKGTSGFLAFGNLERLTHVGEGLLSRLRDGELTLTPDITSVLLELVDEVRAMLVTIEQTGGEGDVDHADLLARLTACQSVAAETPPDSQRSGEAQHPTAQPALAEQTTPAATARQQTTPEPAAHQQTAAYPSAEPVPPGQRTSNAREQRAPLPAPAAGPIPDGLSAADAARRLLGERLVEEGLVRPDDVTLAVLEQQTGDARRIGEILVEHGAVDASTLHEVLGSQPDERRTLADSSVRVDIATLDNLMRLVGELLLTRNQLTAAVMAAGDLTVTRAWQRLSAISGELQDGVMRVRMQPIDNVWSKLPRMVRDLGQAMGKRVRLELVGGDTELDRSVLEAVKDPITHIVRNALDHGLESPEARVRAGKPAEGQLRLHAYHEDGLVHIDVTDDGVGIDPARIADTAIRSGLLTRAEAAAMTERDLVNCIFLPGFSTAQQVTNVSGRGVGMDVVKTNLERIGGSCEVSSTKGVGTTIRVKIPLTLAIVSALVVSAGGERYVVQQANVLEVVLVGDRDSGAGIEHIAGAPVYRLRGQLLPLVRLREVLGITERAGRPEAPTDEQDGAAERIVVVGGAGRRFGVVVDDVVDTEEVVVKPLSRQLKGIGCYAGTTILSDGRVALILDTWGIAAGSNVGAVATRSRADDSRGDGTDERGDLRDAVLVTRIADDRLLALPLAGVSRLEDVAEGNVEQVGARQALQYRGGILPIVRLGELVTGAGSDRPESAQVVVYTERGRSVGLVVDEILDVVDDVSALVTDIDGPGVTGTTVVATRVMELLDLKAAVLAADPHFYDDVAPVGDAS